MNTSPRRRFKLRTFQSTPTGKSNESLVLPNKSFNHKFYAKITLALMVVGILTSGLIWRLRGVSASGTLTGTVYLDYNMNGANDTAGTSPNLAIDSGVSGVVVTAYDSGGTQRGTATTAANGTFSVSATGTGPYRLEFTTLPTGYYPSAIGTNNASTVRFVADGNSSGNDLGLTLPDSYSQNNPTITIAQYLVGDVSGASLVGFPYTYSNDNDGNIESTSITASPTRTASLGPLALGDNANIGAVYGLAWNRFNRRLYTSAYIKRGAKLGSLSSESTGAIYVKTETGSPTLYVDLNTVFGAGTAGTNPHPVSSNPDWNTGDTAARDVVGKAGLGDLEISQDGSQLYVVNFADRRLYTIPTTGTLNSTTITRTDIPTSGLTTSSGNCATADVRPFGLGRDASGQIYVGAVCSAESSASAAQLHAYVWRFASGSFTLVANNALTFTRVVLLGSPNTTRTWMPWANTDGTIDRPAPMLADIEFNNGAMILGFRDRYGDQAITLVPDSFNRGYGDIMRACVNGATWTFESNGTCGGTTTGGAGSGSGNGGGEFYIDLNGDGREEGLMGAMLQVPGYNHSMTTAYDPVAYSSAGTRITNYYTGGVQRYHNTTGVLGGAYDVYLDADPDTFGKANGVGDIEFLPDAAPLQIGNRVWSDTDGDGIQDPGESGVQNVSVQLWADTNADGVADTQVGTATTDSNGNYLFGGPNNSNLSANSSCTGTVSYDVLGSSNDAEQEGTTVSLTDSPLELGRSSNSVDNTVAVRFPTVNLPKGANVTNATITFTANAASSNTVAVTVRGEAADNAATYTTAASNLSGRTTTSTSAAWSIGAWTAGATTNATTPNLNAIVNEIISRAGWSPNNSLSFIITNNGSTGTRSRDAQDADTSATEAPTLSLTYQCPYTVNTNTKYEVRIPASNFTSGNALNAIPQLSRQNSDSTTNGDSRDSDGINSVVNGGGTSVLAPVTTGGYGQNNHTVDFGFKAATVSIGNRIWNDLDNSGTLNGAETGLTGVLVELYDSAGTTLLASTTTDLSGYYSFTGLTSATAYRVRLAASNFNTGGAFYGWASSTGTDGATTGAYEGASTPDANPATTPVGGTAISGTTDTDDNGTTTGTLGSNGYIETRVNVTVTTNTNYTGETDGNGVGQTDASNNLSVDFGLWQPFSIGNRAWFDTNNNGLRAAGTENAITAGVSLSLFLDANEDGTPDNIATPIATLTTDANGYYRFDNLKANSYVIRANASNFQSGGALIGYQSSGTTENAPNSDVDDNDNGRDAATLTNPQYNVNGVLSGTITLSGTAEPTAETDTLSSGLYAGQGASDNKANLTVDLGFYKLTLSGTVWNDNGAGANRNNALLDAGETGRSGVVMRLYDNSGNEIGIGLDGILGTADDVTTITDATRVVTDSNGNYSFQGLPPGTYTVRFATPSGTISSGDIASSANPNNNTNSDDNGQPGTGSTAGFTLSASITLTPGSSGALGNNSVSNTTGTTQDPTLDFGLVPLGPTVVKLAEFTAVSDGAQTLLQWRSGAEKDNLGFNVYRVGANGVKTKLNPEILAGSLLQIGRTALTAGSGYAWLDDNSGAGARYLLEDVDASGKRNLYGPVIAQPVSKLPAKAAPLARRLSQLNEARASLNGPSANGGANATANSSVFVRPSITATTAARLPLDSPAWQRQLWVAQQPSALRLGITQTGWYRVTGAQMQTAGFDLNGLAASNLQLYADGVEVPLGLINARQVLDSASAIEFYGVASDTRESGTRTYWLVAGDRAGLRFDNPRRVAPGGRPDMENVPTTGGMMSGGVMGTGGGMTGGGNSTTADSNSTGSAEVAASYQQTLEIEERFIYLAALKNGEDAGNFYGAVVTGTPVTQTFTIDNADAGSSTSATLTAELFGVNDAATHRVQVSLNGNLIGEATWAGFAPHTARFRIVNSALLQGTNTLTLKALGGSNDVSLIQRVRLSYARRHVAQGGQLWFATGKTPQNVNVSGFSTAQTRLFDVTDAARPFLVSSRTATDPTGYALSAERLAAKRTFLAVSETAFQTPATITRATPSHWTDTTQRADFLIIAPAAWREAVQPLAAARAARGLATQIIAIEDILAEWGGGERSVSALRGFLKWTAQNWATAPRYVLLVGDASFDPRDYLQLGAHDYVPTGWAATEQLETMSDESLTDFNGDGVGEMSVGRWPVRSASQAAALTVKTLGYHPDLSRGALFVADADGSGEDFAGMNQSLRNQLPGGTPSQTLVRGTQPDNALRQAILNAANNGPAIIHYAGHGSPETWTGDSLLTSSDANQLANNGRLSVYVMLTCLNGYFADEWSESLAEALLKAPNGGAVAVWASSGLTVPSSQQTAGAEWYRQTLTNGARLGDAVRAAKRATTDTEVRSTWILFGDPTLVIR